MKDSISARIRRIITGTANSIVSRIEGLAPETILEQAIDEVDSAIDEVKAELGLVIAQKYHVSKAMSRLNEENVRLEEQILVAMREGRDDLAEAAVGRQVDIEDQLPALENQLAHLAGQEKELNQAITGLIAKRSEMEDELFHFKQSARSSSVAFGNGSSEAGRQGGAEARADRADKAFSRVLEGATGVRRETLRTSRSDSAKLVELAHLSRRVRIEAKLQALKEGGETQP